MRFKTTNISRTIGEKTGYVTAYIIFSTILYFILKLFNKIPDDWNFVYILPFTYTVVLLGSITTLLLK